MKNNNKTMTIRRSNERGHSNHGWLDSYFTFSFADYYDAQHMSFRSLRVINEDRVSPSEGFGTHPHKDMEIITYVIEGELQHKDSMGTGSIIRPGEIQKMSAGSGVTHSEFNASSTKTVHLLQIWIVPEKKNLKPEYQQITYQNSEGLTLIGSHVEKPEAVWIHQSVELYRGFFSKGKSFAYDIAEGRGVWIQMIKGELDVQGQKILSGDGLAVEGEKILQLESLSSSEFLLFDLGS